MKCSCTLLLVLVIITCLSPPSNGNILNSVITRGKSVETECWELCSMDFEKCREFYECNTPEQPFESPLCSSCAKRSMVCLDKCTTNRK